MADPDFLIKPFGVSVSGYPEYTFFARSRGKALSKAWDSYRCGRDISFMDFLRIAKARRVDPPHERFGERITVGGRPAFLVSWNSQYMQFVQPCDDTIYHTHPLDVEPPEARRGTPYYEETNND